MNKILAVDDDPHIRELIRVLLRGEGFETEEAEDGREALKKLETFRADLCILDVMMPNMDGWTFCEEARQYWDFPILMLTAKAETLHKVKGFNLGADPGRPHQPPARAVPAGAL